MSSLRAAKGMDAMRTLRSVLRKLILPVACFACAAWAAGFVISFSAMHHRNVGTLVLFAIGGLVLLLPWLVITLAILGRMRGRAAVDAKQRPGDVRDDSARSGTGAPSN